MAGHRRGRLNPTVVVLKHLTMDEIAEVYGGLNPTVVVLKLLTMALMLARFMSLNPTVVVLKHNNHNEKNATTCGSQSNRSGFETTSVSSNQEP